LPSGAGLSPALTPATKWPRRIDTLRPRCQKSGAVRPYGYNRDGASAYLIAALANFAYLYPILTAKVIPYSAWLSRKWFTNWI
jgi:dolichyl-phosphate-mannose--protein O-mannosyl transferase